MRLIFLISRYLLGALFTIFGVNGFLHFIPEAPPSTTSALQYITALTTGSYMAVVFLFQLVSGVLLLSGYFVPLALTVLAAIITNILLYHLTLDPQGVSPALIVTVLWIVVFLNFRPSFKMLLSPKPDWKPAS